MRARARGKSWRCAVVFLLAAGCADAFDIEKVDPADYGRICVGRYGMAGAGLFDVCLSGPPPETLDAPPNIDTNACDVVVAQTDTAGTEVCVVAARHVEITTALTATGERPLVLIATEDMVVSGTLSVASHDGSQLKGAGHDPTFCPNSLRGQAPPMSPLGHAGGGGAGGSFGTRGGDGGNGAGPAMGAVAELDAMPPAFVHGGCDGGGGAAGQGTVMGGQHGSGGGAIYLLARRSLVIRGQVNASGEPGEAGHAGQGGGGGGGGAGGGAGGLIGLDSPHVTLEAGARLLANGGGGGGGGGSTADGGSGGEADSTTPFPYVATGGAAGGMAGAGGAGAADMMAAMSGALGAAGGGGGGGGGGAGYIMIFTEALDDAGALVTPPYSR